jgi:hypothetical protein
VYIDEESETDDIEINRIDPSTYMSFDPAGPHWQDKNCQIFNIKVRNYHKHINSRPMLSTSQPINTPRMRGDGNCLFRTFSYIVSGVQSYFNEVRQAVVEFMLTHSELFEGYADESLSAYLNRTEMWNSGEYGTDVEIRAFSTMTNTNVFVFCDYGDKRCWINYPPLSSTNNSLGEASVYIVHKYDHYEPVLDINEEIFSKPPYIPIGSYVPKDLKMYVPSEMLEGSLVNNFKDESILQELPSEFRQNVIYVQTFKYKSYNIRGLEHVSKRIEPNVFNLLCDQGDFVKMLS